MPATANAPTATSRSDESTLTLRCALEVSMITARFERLPNGTLAKIAENGRAYTNEAKHMAAEIIELRRQVEALQREKAERTAVAPHWFAP